MKPWHTVGLVSCLFSCQLLFNPNPQLYLENTTINCFDGVDNDGENGADCADPSCDSICNDDQLTISALTSNNCTIVEHEALSGDDRGGIAVALNQVLYSGDLATVIFRGDDLAAEALPVIYDAMFSDLRSGKLFTFLDALSAPVRGPSGFASSFQEIDPLTGALLNSPVVLSQALSITDAGFFSGKGLVIIQGEGGLFSINISDGAVTTLPSVPSFKHQSCENKAYWGIAETADDKLSLVYVANETTIERTHITDSSAATEVVARFATLSDMCSISVSPSLGRWYFHAEGLTSLTSIEEHVGYCDALFGDVPSPACGDGIFQAPEQCDDGNNVDSDGCSACLLDACGDGTTNNVVQGHPFEVCDDGNNTDGDGCRSDCRGIEACGDNLLDINEQCDDNNNIDRDGCEANCTFVCGVNLSQKASFFNDANLQCYELLSDVGDWLTMRDLCISVGGDLASFSDASELAVVLPVAANFSPWIGFSDINLEGTFVWSNGDAVTFTNFAAGQPDDFNGNEDCVHLLGDGTWNDFPCTKTNHPLCEIPTQ
jgi:cysteine-rich repeat protein